MTADLDGLPFTVVRRGFDRDQVEERLGTLLADLKSAVVERDRLTRQLDDSRSDTRSARTELAETRAEVERLAGQVAELSVVPSTVDGMSDRLQQMVRIAQDEVNDMRTRATRSAAQILSMAQAEADELGERSAQQRRAFEAEQREIQEELRARIDESRAHLRELREESDGQRARLDAELAERRTRDEQVLAAEVAERREALLGELAAQEKRQHEEARRITEAASAQARTVVAEATAEAERSRAQVRDQVSRAHDELEELRALQHQVAEQLTGVRSLLDWTLPRFTAAGNAVSAGTSAAPEVAVIDGRSADDTEPARDHESLPADPSPAAPAAADLVGASTGAGVAQSRRVDQSGVERPSPVVRSERAALSAIRAAARRG
jgi:chromosome segregation ATPase